LKEFGRKEREREKKRLKERIVVDWRMSDLSTKHPIKLFSL
jgi:hypothetical protein